MKENVVMDPAGVGETSVGTAGEVKKRAVGAPRPKYCRTFTRARVAEALPDIVERFATEAKNGSIAHAKVLMKLGGLDTAEVVAKGTKRRGKSMVALLLENLKEDPPVRKATPAMEGDEVESRGAE